jgi:hypothetical protein
VEALLPSLALRVIDEGGRAFPGARVSIDGVVRTAREGEPLVLDPGSHWVEVAASGRAPVKEFVKLAAGDRGRALVVVLRPSTPPPAMSPPATPLPTPPAPSTAAAPPTAPASVAPGPPASTSERVPAPELAPRGHRTRDLVLGGLAVTGLVAFGVLGVTGYREANRLRSTCAPGCAEGDVTSVRRRLVAADVSLALALVSGGLWFALGGRF